MSCTGTADQGKSYTVRVTCAAGALEITVTVGGQPVAPTITHVSGDVYEVTVDAEDTQTAGVEIVTKCGTTQVDCATIQA